MVRSGGIKSRVLTSRQIRDREVPARPSRDPATILARPDAYLSLPPRAGTTSIGAARRASQRGVGNSKVYIALKQLPALEPNPVLSCKPPLSPPQGLYFKEMTGAPTRVSGAAWAGVGGGLGGRSGALGGGTTTLHPLDPWQVLHINFWELH